MIFKKKEKKDIKTHIKSYDLILNPIITEKATTLSSFSQVVLSVPFDSNKKQINKLNRPDPWSTQLPIGFFGIMT